MENYKTEFENEKMWSTMQGMSNIAFFSFLLSKLKFRFSRSIKFLGGCFLGFGFFFLYPFLLDTAGSCIYLFFMIQDLFCLLTEVLTIVNSPILFLMLFISEWDWVFSSLSQEYIFKFFFFLRIDLICSVTNM